MNRSANDNALLAHDAIADAARRQHERAVKGFVLLARVASVDG
jgi:hypothetical protein